MEYAFIVMVFVLFMCIGHVFVLFIDSVFGADLTEEISRTHGEAPAVVMKCVEEIEKACSDHGMFIIEKSAK